MAGPLLIPLINAGIAAGGAVAGIISRNKANKENKRRIEEQRAETRELMQKHQENQKDMWHYTNFSNQRKEMERAGLSVGMMYGGAGGGGSTVGSGGTAQASQEERGDYDNAKDINQMGQMAMQISLMKAQKENIEADTKNKLSDAGYTGGAKTDNTNANTEGVKQDIETKKFDNDIRSEVGKRRYVEKIESELVKEKAENKVSYRRAINLIDALDEGDGDLVSDAFGGYTTGSKWTTLGKNDAKMLLESYSKLQKEIKQIAQSTEESKSRESLNKVNEDILNFKADLTKLGLNETTTRILEMLIKLMIGGKK